MNMLEFIPAIAPNIRSDIESELAAIERDHDVRILFAVESGSRAWGFPSPDSDYDVRFVYIQRQDWYLSLEPGRDVIELPISAELDINGWDLRKALNLLLKPNPVLLEWLSSPIAYRWDHAATAELQELAGAVAHQTACRRHYLSIGEGQWQRHVGEAAEVNCKKYFYILRPALALRWIRMNPDRQPPMNLQSLVKGLDMPPLIIEQIGDLLRAKSMAREVGMGPRIPAIDALIHSEFEIARQTPDARPDHDHQFAANALFRRFVKGDAA
jgi:uncharacterized protein